MRMWLDTEFNQYGGQTISLGIIADNGAEFYEAIEMTETPKPWVEAHVLPVLGKAPVSRFTVQERLAKWLNQFGSLQIYVDHPADAQRFLALLETDEIGGWYEVPGMLIAIVTGLPGTQKQYSAVEHNALSDARALKERYQEKDKVEAVEAEERGDM